MFKCVKCGKKLRLIDRLPSEYVYGKEGDIVHICCCVHCLLDFEISVNNSGVIKATIYNTEK